MSKILFISHEASLTGAPVLLLRLIEQIKKHSSLEILILLKEGGELAKDFEAIGKTLFWNRPIQENNSFNNRWRNRIYRKLGIPTFTKQQLYKKAILKEVDQVNIVFNNTIATIDLLKELPLQGKQIFCYIHELSIVAEMLATREEIAYMNTISEKIFVPALAVKEFFVRKHQVPESKIVLLPSIIPQQNLKAFEVDRMDTNRIGGTQFLIGFCGTLDSRKGFDLLPLVARKLIHEINVSGVHFLWIGVNKSSFNYLILYHDLVKLKLEGHFTFIETKPGIQHYLAQLDVFVLPSREDPFPLVVMEAALYGVPCIYFVNAGGISEFCGSDAGIGVDYLDIDGLADAIVRLKSDEVLRKELGERAKEKVAGYSDTAFNVNTVLQYFKIPIT